MVSDYGYTTVSRLADRTRSTIDGTTNPTDTTVDEIISEAESIINIAAGTRFDSGNAFTDDLYDHDGSNTIILKQQPIQTVTSIEYSKDGGDTWTALSSSDYRLVTDYNMIERDTIRGSSWPTSGYANVRITGTYGYSSVPLNIRSLATDLAAVEVLRTALRSSANEEGGSVKVGPLEVRDPSSFSIDAVSSLKEDTDERLKELNGSRFYTTVGKRWGL